MVQNAFPGGSKTATSAAAVQSGGSIALIQQLEAPAMDHLPAGPSLFIEDDSSLVESFDQSVQSPMSFELYDDEFNSDLREDEDPYAREHPLEARLPDAQEDRSPQLQAATPISGFETTLPDTEHTEAEAEELHTPAQSGALNESSAGPLTSLASLFDDPSKEQHVTSETPATDPWEDPLPAWDYSQNEWPVLVGPKRRSGRSLKVTLAVVVLLVCAVALYVLIHQLAAKQQRTSTPASASARERAPGAAESHAATAKPADLASQSRTASSAAEAPASPVVKAATATEDANAHGRFSLQAAAFPTRAGADEFADKLRNAGVPSYIVNTDLGRRGTWFRVRVGRFNTAEDAQKFAVEAQRRGKTVGRSLQLIVCQYEQP
jgi:cell division septation protein DedD